MPFTPFTIDDSFEREQTGGKPYLVEGDYLFKVVGITPSPETHNGKAAYWRWKLVIEKGPYGAGRTFPHNGTWSAEAQWGNGTILRIVAPSTLPQMRGKSFTSYAGFQKLTEQVANGVKGKLVGAVVADDEPYMGKEQSQIIEFYPAADYDRRARTTPAPTPKSPNGPAPAAPQQQNLSDIVDDLFAEDLV